MKKLSDFKDADGVAVVAKLLRPIGELLKNVKGLKYETPIEFISLLLEKNPKPVMEIFAIMNEVPPDEYHCTGVSLMVDTLTLASDKELMELFGLQSQTQTSSGSASENTEGIQK